MNEIIDILKEQKVFDLKNASAELHFDDVGILQKITFRQKRRKRDAENIKIFPVKNGSSHAHYDRFGVIQHITYETEWMRPRQKQ